MAQLSEHSPLRPVPYDRGFAAIARAVYEGRATPLQQRRFYAWLIQVFANIDDLSARMGVDGDRETMFAEGRRFVGMQIEKHVAWTERQDEKGTNLVRRSYERPRHSADEPGSVFAGERAERRGEEPAKPKPKRARRPRKAD